MQAEPAVPAVQPQSPKRSRRGVVAEAHSRRKCRSQPARRQLLCATGWADQSKPGLSGGLRELENAPAERGQVPERPCDRGVNSRVNKDVDHASFTRRHTAVHTTVEGLSGHLPTLVRRAL